MIEKNIKARVIHKHDTAANWAKATNFIPKQGEIIIYDIDSAYDYERFKIGDGVTKVGALPFALDSAFIQVLASGEFDGEDGYTPVRGVDYWTQEDKTAIMEYVDEVVGNMETGVTLPTLTNEGTAADLMAGKEMIDSSGNIVVGTFSLEDELAAQTELIEQLKTALENKGAGGGGGNDEYKALATSLIDRKATKIVIPEGTTEIGNYAFCDFDYLTEVEIPNTVTKVGYRTFYACPVLNNLVFPASVTTFVTGQQFVSSTSLTTITFLSTTPPTIQANTLTNTMTTIYVPSASVDAYKTATNWSAYADKIVGI